MFCYEYNLSMGRGKLIPIPFFLSLFSTFPPLFSLNFTFIPQNACGWLSLFGITVSQRCFNDPKCGWFPWVSQKCTVYSLPFFMGGCLPHLIQSFPFIPNYFRASPGNQKVRSLAEPLITICLRLQFQRF